MELSHRVDECLPETAVVFGSLPPEGRDLDILVRDPGTVIQALLAERAAIKGSQAAWFADGSAYGVDVVDVSGWRLSGDEPDQVFAEARPIGGFHNLVRPAPHHVLLIAARRVARSGVLDAKRRARIDGALAEDPASWERAADRARAWHATGSLQLLRKSMEGNPLTTSQRVAALTEEISAHVSGARARALAVKTVLGGRTHGHAISFSGLDGSGKTTQAEALRDALGALGIEAVCSWTKIARDPILSSLAAVTKRVLRTNQRPPEDPSQATADSAPGPTAEGLSPAVARGNELSRRSAIVNSVWTTVVAIANGRTQRRSVLQHLRAGRVVICDRYVLDTAAHLRYRYGLSRTYAFQVFLNKLISPRTLRSFLLDVPPEEALRRKREQYDVAQLTLLARLYREGAEKLGVDVVDGTMPAEELKTAIARDVWDALP